MQKSLAIGLVCVALALAGCNDGMGKGHSSAVTAMPPPPPPPVQADNDGMGKGHPMPPPPPPPAKSYAGNDGMGKGHNHSVVHCHVTGVMRKEHHFYCRTRYMHFLFYVEPRQIDHVRLGDHVRVVWTHHRHGDVVRHVTVLR